MMRFRGLFCRWVGVLAFGAVCSVDAMTAEEAMEALDSEFWSRRRGAVKRLTEGSGKELAPLTSRLVDRLEEGDAEDWDLARILEKAPPNADEAARVKSLLQKAIDEKNSLRLVPLSRAWAALADPNRQAYHRVVLDRMVEAVREEDEEALAGARAELDLSDSRAEEQVLEALPDADAAQRRILLKALGQLAGSPAEGIARLKSLVREHPEWAVELDDAMGSVKEENVPPSIRLAAPVEVEEGRSVTFEVEVSDPDNVEKLLKTRVVEGPDRGELEKVEARRYAFYAPPGTRGTVRVKMEVADTQRDGVGRESFALRVRPDRDPPRVLSASRHVHLDPDRIELIFSEPVEAGSNPSGEWTLSEGRIVSVRPGEEGRTAVIGVEGAPAEGELELMIDRLSDRAATPNVSRNLRVRVEAVTWQAGLRYRYWEGGRGTQQDPGGREPEAEGPAENFLLDVAESRENFALMFEGVLRVEQAGAYTFYLISDDGSLLYLDGEPVVDNGGYHGMETESGTVELEVGMVPLRLHYYQGGGGKGLEVEWSGPGFDRQPVPADVLLH